MRAGLILIVLSAAAACVRDEATPICADVAPGELVITEIHGDRSMPWVELYNASGRPVALDGARVLFQKTDGTVAIAAVIRRALPVAAGAYTVLGYVDDDLRPSFVDYGFAGDWHGAAWLDSAAVDVEVCGERIDRMQYSALPTAGSYSLGATPPTAAANDASSRWCRDPAGTPQQANRPCA